MTREAEILSEIRDLSLGGRFIEDYYKMHSRSAEAEAKKYRIALGKSSEIWLYNTGDNVYTQGGPNSDGFGGRSLKFTLSNGYDFIELKGPWHANSDALFKATGIDIRNQHLTIGVIGKSRSWNNGRCVIEDILYFDKEPKFGCYDRVRKLAEDMASSMNETIYYHMSSISGASNGPVNPRK
jgi:hypothetical protein